MQLSHPVITTHKTSHRITYLVLHVLLLPADQITVILFCMVSVKLTMLNCSECKIILFELSVNRRTTQMLPDYCVNCIGCLYGIKLLTKLLLLRIARETVSNLVIYWTHSFHISLLEHYVHQVPIYQLYLTLSRLLPHLVLSEQLRLQFGAICLILLKLQIRSMFLSVI